MKKYLVGAALIVFVGWLENPAHSMSLQEENMLVGFARMSYANEVCDFEFTPQMTKAMASLDQYIASKYSRDEITEAAMRVVIDRTSFGSTTEWCNDVYSADPSAFTK